MFQKIGQVFNWVSKQPNLISSASHALICTVVMAFGLLTGLAVYFVDPGAVVPLSVSFIVYWAGFCHGGYTFREGDEVRQAVNQPGEGKKFGESFEDWIIPFAWTILLGVVFVSWLT